MRGARLARAVSVAATSAALTVAALPPSAAAQNEPLLIVANGADSRLDLYKLDGTPAGMIGSQGSGPGQFLGPAGLAVGPGGVIAAADSGNGEIDLFQRDGTFIRALGTPGSGPGQLNGPTDAGFSPDGDLVYVADFNDNQVEVLRADDGAHVRTIGSPGSGDGQLDRPIRVQIGPDGSLFVGEDGNNNRIQVFNPASGAFVRKFGGTGSAPGQFNAGVTGLAFTAAGDRLFAADIGNHRIQVFNPADGSHQYSFGQFGFAPGFLAQPFGVALVEGAGASARSLRQADPPGQVVVPDGNRDKVLKYATDGAFLSEFDARGPADVAVLTPLGAVDLSVVKSHFEVGKSRGASSVGLAFAT